MILFPNCKINIGLQVIAKRADGFHNLQTVFYPAKWYDAVEILPAPDGETTVRTTGKLVEAAPENNLCYKAWKILKNDFWHLPEVQFILHKAIPVGAGLGGGSADAAFVLKGLNAKFSLGLSAQKLIEYAGKLGSDCSFFITGRPVYAEGRGEILSNVELNLDGYSCIIVYPSVAVATAWAFGQVKPSLPVHDLRSAVALPVEEWRDKIFNDFERPIFGRFPQIEALKQQLYRAGAIYASLSGSGSAVFAIFREDDFRLPVFPANFVTKIFRFSSGEQ